MDTISNISASLPTMQWNTVNNAQAEPRQTQPEHVQELPADSVQVHASKSKEPVLIADEDVQNVMNDTVNMINADPFAALHVHSGLDASRVAALVA